MRTLTLLILACSLFSQNDVRATTVLEDLWAAPVELSLCNEDSDCLPGDKCLTRLVDSTDKRCYLPCRKHTDCPVYAQYCTSEGTPQMKVCRAYPKCTTKADCHTTHVCAFAPDGKMRCVNPNVR